MVGTVRRGIGSREVDGVPLIRRVVMPVEVVVDEVREDAERLKRDQ